MQPHSVIGRYALYDVIASGGMATVHFGQLLGPVGFARTVAIKRLHPRFSRDPEFVSMFIDEARLAARIRHPNVVPVLDVVQHEHELYLVMEYALGISFGDLLRRARERDARLPIDVAAGVVCGCLDGLHAAHEARDEQGALLGIVHRDVSPSNILVGRDGVARVLDFGVAKAIGRAHITQQGEVKGKPTYMAPEQLRGAEVTRATDIHAAAVTFWEALAGRRAYPGKPDEIVVLRRRGVTIVPLREIDPALSHLDSVIERGVAPAPEDRWPTARAMADAIRCAVAPAMAGDIADWLAREMGEELEQRARIAATLESTTRATSLRAAIRAEFPTDPSVSWTALDDSDVETLEDHSSSRRAPGASGTDPERSDSQVLAALAARERDITPTIVETTGSRSGAVRGRSWTGSGALAAEPPPWHDESPTVARRSSRRSQLMVAAAVAMVFVAGLVVLRVLLRDDPVSSESQPSVSATAGPAASLEPLDVGSPTVAATSGLAPREPRPADSGAGTGSGAPAARTTTAGAREPRPATAGARASARPTALPSTAASAGPFDELGGRH